MENIPFNINDWMDKKSQAKLPIGQVPASIPQGNVEEDIERVVKVIESSKIDLTADYNNWIKIGFALAHELGERGRSYFHRISAMYPGYSLAKTDKKYDNCVKNQHQGTTIKTFFFLAKEAGIDLAKEKKNNFRIQLKRRKLRLRNSLKKKISTSIPPCCLKVFIVTYLPGSHKPAICFLQG